MSKFLNYYPDKKLNNVLHVHYASNQKELGLIYQEVDGFYVYAPVSTGTWSGEVLVELGNKLVDMNKKWAEELAKGLK